MATSAVQLCHSVRGISFCSGLLVSEMPPVPEDALLVPPPYDMRVLAQPPKPSKRSPLTRFKVWTVPPITAPVLVTSDSSAALADTAAVVGSSDTHGGAPSRVVASSSSSSSSRPEDAVPSRQVQSASSAPPAATPRGRGVVQVTPSSSGTAANAAQPSTAQESAEEEAARCGLPIVSLQQAPMPFHANLCVQHCLVANLCVQHCLVCPREHRIHHSCCPCCPPCSPAGVVYSPRHVGWCRHMGLCHCWCSFQAARWVASVRCWTLLYSVGSVTIALHCLPPVTTLTSTPTHGAYCHCTQHETMCDLCVCVYAMPVLSAWNVSLCTQPRIQPTHIDAPTHPLTYLRVVGSVPYGCLHSVDPRICIPVCTASCTLEQPRHGHQHRLCGSNT